MCPGIGLPPSMVRILEEASVTSTQPWEAWLLDYVTRCLEEGTSDEALTLHIPYTYPAPSLSSYLHLL